MNAHEKARLLGLLFWIYTAFNVLIVAAIAVIYIGLFGLIFSQTPQKAGDPPPELIMTILIVAFAIAFVFVILFSVPKIIAGYGLRKEKPWAWMWAVVASIMACMSFPFGTAIGVFGLIFLFSDEGKRYFNDPAYRSQLSGTGNVTPPPANSWQ
jgi:hypothetical protein